jgi:hypothetical protein
MVALGRGLGLLKTAVVADCAALNDGTRRHIANAVTNKGPEADAGRNGVVAHPRLGMVPAIAAFWVELVGRPLQRVVVHIFVPLDFCPGSRQCFMQLNADFFAGCNKWPLPAWWQFCPPAGRRVGAPTPLARSLRG